MSFFIVAWLAISCPGDIETRFFTSAPIKAAGRPAFAAFGICSAEIKLQVTPQWADAERALRQAGPRTLTVLAACRGLDCRQKPLSWKPEPGGRP